MPTTKTTKNKFSSAARCARSFSSHRRPGARSLADLRCEARRLGITLSQNGQQRTKAQLTAAIYYKKTKKIGKPKTKR